MDKKKYINPDNPVYISYAWGEDLEIDVNKLCELMDANGIYFKRDKAKGENSLCPYRYNIIDAEEEIGKGKAIIVVISDRYIKSLNCMYEWHCICKTGNIAERVFPIVLPGTKLREEWRYNSFHKHFEERLQEISDKEVKSSANAIEKKLLDNNGYLKDLEKLRNHLIEYNIPDLESLREGDYSIIIQQLKEYITKIEESKKKEKPDFPEPSSKIATQSNGHCLTSPPSDANAANVIGREDDLEKLWKKLSEKKHVLLTGLGGIGKTKLAQMLFHNYRDRFEEVAWIKYKEDLRHSFSYHIEKYQNVKDPWEAMMNDLHNDGKKKLFIIDNVDDDTDQCPENDKDLRNLTGWKDTTILLTSRLEKLEHFIRHVLKPLGKESCVSVFNHYYEGNEPDPEMVGKIVKLANYHTLTIELLAKGAKRENLESYYEKVKSGFETISRKMPTEHHDGNVTIEEHLKTLFDMQHRSDTDKKVLNSFAVLPVNCECSLEEVEQWFGFENEELDEVIKDGWLLFDESKQTFSMHPLIRTIVRFDFLEDGQGKKTIAPEGTADKILKYFSEASFDIGKGYLFLQRRIDIAESVINAVAQKETELVTDVLLRSGNGYYYMGDYDKALEYFWKALEIIESKLGKDHPSTATTYNSIGRAYRAKGDHAKALEHYKKALEIRESKLGKDHPDTAKCYNNIAVVYRNMGENANALEYHEKARRIRESKLGKDHPDTAQTYNNIGEVYRAKDEYDNALEYYRKALDIKESKLGKDHPSTATTYNNIGEVYKAKCDYDMALEYYEKTLIIKESKLGEDHPSTATTYNNIAAVYYAKGDYVNALEYYLKAFRVRLIKIKNHPDTISSFQALAICYQKANMEKEMDEWMKERLNEKEWEAYLELKGL